MKSSKASQQNRLLRIITVPVRVLSKARDFYVKSMTEYADRMNYGSAMAIPGGSQASGLPRSFSAKSYNAEDFQELVRASSARSFGNRADLDLYIKQQQTKAGSGPRAMPPRSSSVAMGRIDEDSPCCYFREDNCKIVSAKNEVNNYSRSKSHAVSARRLSGF